MDPNERSRALPEVDDVLKRHGHSGGVGVPGRSERPRPPEPTDPAHSTGASDESGPHDTRRPFGEPPQTPSSDQRPTEAPPGGAPPGKDHARRPRGSGMLGVLLLLGGGLWLTNGTYESSGGGVDDAAGHVVVQLDGVDELTVRGFTGPGSASWVGRAAFPGGCEVAENGARAASEPLRLQASCRQPWLGDTEVDLDVPAGTRVFIQGGDADVRVTGQLAGVSVTTDTGDVRFERLTGHMAASSQSSDIRLEDVSGWVWADAQSGRVRGRVDSASAVTVRSAGDVDLSYSGEVTTTTIDGSEDVDLELASGAARLDLQSAGTTDSSVDNSDTASQRVTIRSGDDIDLSY